MLLEQALYLTGNDTVTKLNIVCSYSLLLEALHFHSESAVCSSLLKEAAAAKHLHALSFFMLKIAKCKLEPFLSKKSFLHNRSRCKNRIKLKDAKCFFFQTIRFNIGLTHCLYEYGSFRKRVIFAQINDFNRLFVIKRLH